MNKSIISHKTHIFLNKNKNKKPHINLLSSSQISPSFCSQSWEERRLSRLPSSLGPSPPPSTIAVASPPPQLLPSTTASSMLHSLAPPPALAVPTLAGSSILSPHISVSREPWSLPPPPLLSLKKSSPRSHHRPSSCPRKLFFISMRPVLSAIKLKVSFLYAS